MVCQNLDAPLELKLKKWLDLCHLPIVADGQHGDFGLMFRSRAYEANFEAVVTNFFIDTAKNVSQIRPHFFSFSVRALILACHLQIIEYVEAIRHCLKPGGIWVNHGPLQWHSEEALMLPYDDLVQLIRDMGFVILEEQRTAASYGIRLGLHGENMRPDEYRPVFFVARRDALVGGP